MKPRREHSSHRQTQVMTTPDHDPYKEKGKPAGHAVCPDCGAVFDRGRWHWGERRAEAKEHRCPACQRIKGKLPAGYLRIEGPFATSHRADLLKLMRNHEAHAKAEHALERIMAIEEHADHLVVTTTDVHLARGLGDALHHAYQGELDTHYNDAEALVRVSWRR